MAHNTSVNDIVATAPRIPLRSGVEFHDSPRKAQHFTTGDSNIGIKNAIAPESPKCKLRPRKVLRDGAENTAFQNSEYPERHTPFGKVCAGAFTKSRVCLPPRLEDHRRQRRNADFHRRRPPVALYRQRLNAAGVAQVAAAVERRIAVAHFFIPASLRHADLICWPR